MKKELIEELEICLSDADLCLRASRTEEAVHILQEGVRKVLREERPLGPLTRVIEEVVRDEEDERFKLVFLEGEFK